MALALVACTADDQVATVRLDLSACLIPQSASAPGCGESLRQRFATTGDGSIPACLAVSSVDGGSGATLALGVSPINGKLSPRGGADALPLPGGGGQLAFRLFILDEPNPALCDPSMFQPERACDARLPRCLMATKTVFGELAADGRLEVTFGGAGQACEFDCNDSCAPGDPDCISVCHQADPAEGAGGALEACDGRDNDCDGLVDEGCDADRDGHCAPGVPVGPGSDCHERPADCDDGDDAIKPGARELCDGVDNNCDGRVDEADSLDLPPACGKATGACALSVQRCDGGTWVAECGAREYGDDWDGAFEERCDDGVDNDCNGRIDQRDPNCECQPGDAARACSVDLGLCGAGTQECVPVGGDDGGGAEGEGEGEAGGAWVWGACSGVTRAEEVCDGLDNDCDGAVDESLVAAEADAVCPDAGICAGRPTICLGGAWRCDAPVGFAREEQLCDGVDEDCDGDVDEDLSPPAGLDVCPVDGVCGEGAAVPRCNGGLGRWRCEYPAQGYEAEERSCDQADNDCDGLVDEGCPCSDGERLPCGTDVGACQPGTQECDGGVWGACVGGVRPAQETCDGEDNDCDGKTDEGLTPAEELCPDAGVCAGQPTVCAEGAWQCAAEGKQDQETACDGKDNDCDGQIDEPEHLQGPARALCAERGVCAGRPNICVAGNWRCDHPPEHELDESRCDGLDNDCDGDTDELPLALPAERPCGDQGVCGAAALRCEAGLWSCQLGAEHEAEPEVSCDGLDNDCDGTVDEAADGQGPLRLPCWEDSAETRGVGVCADGHYLCRGDEWDESECIGQVRPGFREECDGLDNDCDGLVDERPFGDGGLIRSCYSGDDDTRNVGECDDGAQACVEGRWDGLCAEEVLPGLEVCNGADDDCNGLQDDLPPLTCGLGRCENEVPACAVGQDNLCTPALFNARDETCDGVDDDCNGVVDDAPRVTCGEGRCEVEVVACTDGRDTVCLPDEDQAVAEVCDGLDDDCDGEVDEGEQPGSPLLSDCYEGPDGSLDVGLCEGGLRTCGEGEFGVCEGQVLPAAEGCTAEDRDCDGELDNGPTPALAPDGAGARAHLTPGFAFGLGDFTVEAWVLRDGQAGDPLQTVARQDGGAGVGSWAIRLVGDAGLPAARVQSDAGTVQVEGDEGIAVGQWTHVAMERWSGMLSLYVGGAVVGSAELDPELRLDPAGAALVFGALSADEERLSGGIDEARISRGARYRGAAFLPSERLVADEVTAHLWRFSEGAGGVAADSVQPAAGGRALTVQGASWTAAGVPDRRVWYSDGDHDGVGAGGGVRRSCGEPRPIEDWAEVLGDCDDADPDRQGPDVEILGNGIDDDCDGRLDGDDGLWAMDLRAGAAYLSVGSAQPLYLRNTDFTVQMWVKLDGYSSGSVTPLAANRKSVGQGQDGWLFGVAGLAADDDIRRRLQFTLDDDAGEHTLVSTRRVDVGRWTHLAVTFAQAQQLATLWIDGRAAGEASLVAVPFGRSVFQIGRDHSLGDIDTHAVIDDLHISTVVRHAQAFVPAVCPAADGDTLVLWNFEEADGAATAQGAEDDLEALLLSGAVRVSAACEEKEAPGSTCLSVISRATEICRDEAAGCTGRATLGGASCADWCGAQGLTCTAAYEGDATCALGAALAGDCDGAAQEAICACSR